VDVATYLDQLEQHGAALGDAADAAGLSAPVPTCPGWDVRELLAHVGMVHRWATAQLRDGMAADRSAPFPAPESGVVEWYRDGHAALVQAVRAAPDDLEAMRFLSDAGPARVFWARRQAHETAIHRADAESARGRVPNFDDAFGLDGIAELLEGFYGRDSRRRLRADPPVSMRIAPDGAGTSWLIELSSDAHCVTRDAEGAANCTLSGPASQLYRWLWNRGGEVTVGGDEHACAVWRSAADIRWS
jgi:uncharacterized protein (TIGR03083 family)